MTWARMRDGSEAEIVRVLEAAGASVSRLNGTGVPDLLVGYQGKTILLEVKRSLEQVKALRGKSGGAARPSEGGDGTLTAAQLKWWERWKGAPPALVRTPDEALAALGVWIEDRRTAEPLYAGAPVASEWRRQATAADFPPATKGKRKRS